VARGVKQIRWDLTRIVDQVRSVCQLDADGCWIWAYGGVQRLDRYPSIMINRKRFEVSRLILVSTTGVTGEVARHACDKPACCRPACLSWGTQEDNIADCWQRGRSGWQRGKVKTPNPAGGNHWTKLHPERIKRGAENKQYGRPKPQTSGDKNGARTRPDRRPHGEGHGLSKLTEQKVLAIRASREAGESVKSLAERFGVSESTIEQVVRRRTWRHV
jgi:hypothetical protein